MVVGTLSLVQKGQMSELSGCSGITVYGGGDIVFGAKRSNLWMQWNSGIWWLGIVFGPKRSNQWRQYIVDTVHSGCSRHSRHSEIVVYGSAEIVFGAKMSNQLIQRTQWNSSIW